MNQRHPLIVGLTGGIGSGKSTVAELFRELGATIIDADVIARALVAPGEPALDEIVVAFGSTCLDARGQLDRGKLRRLVFSDPTRRHQLEAILHPKITQGISRLIANVRTPYCIVVIPLLLETRQTGLVDRILVVDTPVNLRTSRVEARDHLPRDEIIAIMKTQASRETQLRAADDVICNDVTLAELAILVQKQHDRYLKIAAGRTG
jgi:dephospho-CoA kinase